MTSLNGIPLEILEKRMKPRGWFQTAFLQEDQSLLEIVISDKLILKNLRVSAQDIAEVLEKVLELGKESDRFHSVHVNHYRVRIIHSRKMLTCPWAKQQFEWCKIGKGVKYLTTEDFEITNMINNKSLQSTSLMIHLIRDHNFFGGPDTPYRIDPKKAVSVLDLRANAKLL
jgi:hypothetical protein